MKHAPVLFAFAYLLAGCGRPQALSVETLAADPARLHVLTAQCRRGEQDGALCARVAPPQNKGTSLAPSADQSCRDHSVSSTDSTTNTWSISGSRVCLISPAFYYSSRIWPR